MGNHAKDNGRVKMRFLLGLISGFVTCIGLYAVNSASLMMAPAASVVASAAAASIASTAPDPALRLQPMAVAPVRANTFATVNPRALTPRIPAQHSYAPSAAVKAMARSGRTGATRWQAYLPEGTTPAPLVILFAGAGRSPLSVLDMWLGTAQQHDLILLSPDSSDAQGFLSDLKNDTLQKMIAKISKTRAVDADRIYLFGHSQGGQVALALANQLSGPWRAVATHAGFPMAASIRDASSAPPLRLYLGDRDQIFGVTAAKEAGKRYARAGHRTELHLIADHGHWFYEIGPKIAADAWQWFQAQ